MAARVTPPAGSNHLYPTVDGRPMSETDDHYAAIHDTRDRLERFFAAQRRVYVSGNLLVFYRPGDRRRHVSPDVFVVKGVAKYRRPNYLVWEEGKAPQIVLEFTSASTRREDMTTKMALYRDVLKVKEYFLFDPYGEYLQPQLRGYRLRGGQYRPIREVGGRLPSQVLGLHLEARGRDLLLYNPATGQYLPSEPEVSRQALALAQEKDAALQEKTAALQEKDAALRRQLEENERLRQQLERLQRPPGGGS